MIPVQPRAVAVSIPYSIQPDGSKVVCLVSSRKHDDQWVLPKGGIEKGETGRQAAVRELWEEAGLRPTKEEVSQTSYSEQAVLKVLDHKAHKGSIVKDQTSEGFIPRAVYEAHEVLVIKGDSNSELDEWPEKEERSRRWVTFQEAVELIKWRKDIHELLIRSSLAPAA